MLFRSPLEIDRICRLPRQCQIIQFPLAYPDRIFLLQIFLNQTVTAHFIDCLISCFKLLFPHIAVPFTIQVCDTVSQSIRIYQSVSYWLIFFAITTTLPFLWEYSQVDNVSSLSPKTAEIPVSYNARSLTSLIYSR